MEEKIKRRIGITFSNSGIYTTLTSEEQVIESGMVLASGEANYADLSGQIPSTTEIGLYKGINEFLTSGELSGVPFSPISGIIYTWPPNSSIYIQTGISGIPPSVSGIKNSILSESGVFASGGNYIPPDLAIFQPYIHYYPKEVTDTASALSRKKYKPFKIDYSFIFQPSRYYNIYSINDYGWDAKDENGSGIFTDAFGIPPSRFR